MIEIITNSFEFIMRSLLNSKNDISWNHIWYLFSFFLKNDFISIFHSFLYNYIQLFDIIDYFSSSTMSAISLINLPSSSALVTLDLHLHLHSKSNLNSLHGYSLSITFWALFSFPVFCSSSSALWAINIPSDWHVPCCS